MFGVDAGIIFPKRMLAFYGVLAGDKEWLANACEDLLPAFRCVLAFMN